MSTLKLANLGEPTGRGLMRAGGGSKYVPGADGGGSYESTDRVLVPSGAMYKHISSHGGRQGISSIFDQDIALINASRQSAIMGRNVRKIKITEGEEPGTYNHNGRIFVSDKKGFITLANGSYLAREKQMREEQEKYISEVIEYLIYDDDLAMDTLGITRDVYDRDFGPKSRKSKDEDIPSSLWDFDARASAVDAAVPGSAYHSGCMAKLRWMVKNGGYSVIIDQGMAPVYEKDNI